MGIEFGAGWAAAARRVAVDRLWQPAGSVLRFLAEERRRWKPGGPPPLRRLRLLAQGFHGDKEALYGRGFDVEAENYLSDYARSERSGQTDAPFAGILRNKLIFWALLGRYSDAAAPIAALIHRGLLMWLDGERSGTVQTLLEGLGALEGRFVVKAPVDSGGSTVFTLERRGNAAVALVDGVELPLGTLADLFAASCLLVCPYIPQAAYAERICSATANTVRLLTMYDDERREAFLAAASHRFGRASTLSIADNWVQGGVSAEIDPASGLLGEAAWMAPDGRRANDRRHPDTGAVITGVAVANWVAIRDGIVRLASRLPYLPYIGWDVIATSSGYAILEGNARPGITVHQMFRPLLGDQRVRRFYRRHGVAGERRRDCG